MSLLSAASLRSTYFWQLDRSVLEHFTQWYPFMPRSARNDFKLSIMAHNRQFYLSTAGISNVHCILYCPKKTLCVHILVHMLCLYMPRDNPYIYCIYMYILLWKYTFAKNLSSIITILKDVRHVGERWSLTTWLGPPPLPFTKSHMIWVVLRWMTGKNWIISSVFLLGFRI